MKRVLIGAVLAGLLCACQQPQARLNAPPHGTTERPSELQDTYAHMIDNALLEDMTMSDIHFYPHRAALNSLGEERLQRLAGLIEVHGGEVRFSTNEDDELVEQRTEAIVAYLARQGINTSHEVVTRDLPGGRGMDAKQAILIKAGEATYTPKENKGGKSLADMKAK